MLNNWVRKKTPGPAQNLFLHKTLSFLTLFNQKSSGKSRIDFPKFFSQITWVGVEVC
jgi:hypothetical protein